MINVLVHSTRFNKPVKVESPVIGGGTTMFAEAQRRNNIIQRMAAECKYKKGDVVKVSDDVKPNVYGDNVQVISILDSYDKFGKNETWPKNDCPLIVHAFSEAKNQYFFCTPGYLEIK